MSTAQITAICSGETSTDMDGRTNVYVYPTKDFTLLMLLTHLQINRDDRNIESRYRNSGRLNFYFPDRKAIKVKHGVVHGIEKHKSEFGMGDDKTVEYNTLSVSCDVGCSCSHDCCGHLCGWNAVITKIPASGLWVVTIHQSFNF